MRIAVAGIAVCGGMYSAGDVLLNMESYKSRVRMVVFRSRVSGSVARTSLIDFIYPGPRRNRVVGMWCFYARCQLNPQVMSSLTAPRPAQILAPNAPTLGISKSRPEMTHHFSLDSATCIRTQRVQKLQVTFCRTRDSGLSLPLYYGIVQYRAATARHASHTRNRLVSSWGTI